MTAILDYTPKQGEIHGFGFPNQQGAGYIEWVGEEWLVHFTTDPSRGYYFIGTRTGMTRWPELVVSNIQKYSLPQERFMKEYRLSSVDGGAVIP